MLLTQVVQRYLAACQARNLRSRTIGLYRDTLTRLLAFLHSRHCTRVSDLTPDVIISLMVRERRHYADTTLRTMRNIIVSFLYFADPSQQWTLLIRKPRIDYKQPRWLEPTEAHELVIASGVLYRRYCNVSLRDRAMIMVMLDTGLRKGELLRLTIADVRWQDNSIYVAASAKSRRDRRVWFGSHAARALRAYLATRPDAPPRSPLWVSRAGQALSPSRCWKIIKEVALQAGLDRVHCHTLRHSACSLVQANGMPPLEAQKIMGHARLQTTLRYSHTSEDLIRRHFEECGPVDRLDT